MAGVHELTPKQRAFAREYCVDSNAVRAAIRAGYSEKSAHVLGSRLLKDKRVRLLIQQENEAAAAKVGLTRQAVLQELSRVALSDIGDAFDSKGRLKRLTRMSPDVRRAIASVEVVEDGEGGHVKKLRLWPKEKALELLGKHFQLWTERLEVKGTLTLAELVAQSYGETTQ